MHLRVRQGISSLGTVTASFLGPGTWSELFDGLVSVIRIGGCNR
jgi:hypothetical protein